MALFWPPSASLISCIRLGRNSRISKPFSSEAVVSILPIFKISEIPSSSSPNFLNPNPFLQSLHCCANSSSSVEPAKSPFTIVFVKGLPKATSEGTLKTAFSQFGEVSRVKVITDKKSKQSLGFAYIWFASEEAAQTAVREMNGKFFDGRFVLVTIAKPGSCTTQVKARPYKF
ncbi:organelle RRM domain-containing protein 2, mitochondrial [Diospyros lotus]|uniref:organelle RRM domain-containing protein 2, mitochondrial n=1 Tax=Diospyros lotus TaxID=55363 RepID=UPI00224D9F60|nr:organelle RRM domain-containing protein 2, mitochondrial [Diospyros lotus]